MSEAGVYGKLPAHGDFIQRNLPSAFVRQWDVWLQHFVAGAKEKIGADWLDVYLMVMPGTVGEHGSIGIQEIGTPCFFAGLFMWVVFHKLAAAPLIPKNHPMLKESYYHTI